MAQLAIHKDFLQEFAKLEKPVQERVTEVFAKFDEATHTGLHLEKIARARDDRFRTIRIDQFWRGVVLAPATGDTYTLLKVLPHDKAYEWARTRRASVNMATGAIELRDVEAIDSSIPYLEKMARKTPTRLFGHVADSDLTRLGVDGQTRDFARTLTDTLQLEAAQGLLPPVQWSVLYGLAAGMSPEEVWDDMGAAISAEQIDPEDLDAAVRRSSDRVLLVKGPEELMTALAHPFDLWRIYLHPVQRAVAEASYRGPARVSGGPGTGKTVVALHRAHQLARQDRGPVLLTTFTSTLAEALERNLALLSETTGNPGTADRVRVEHVDRLAHRVFREAHGRPNLLLPERERELWQRICAGLGVDLSPAFLAEEWRQVVLAQRVGSASEYLAAKRTGRGRGLAPTQKARVWQAVWEFQRELSAHGLWTHETVCEEAARLLAERPDTDRPFRHVVVDEAQDLGAHQWRLLRAAVPHGPDDLFVAGDTHQSIYGPGITLSEVGVNVRGRSSKLRINYRTTGEILGWSLGLMQGQPVNDLDGGPESLTGCRSEMHGAEPTAKGFANQEAESAHLKETVRAWLDAGVLPAEIGVAARSNRAADQALLALEEAGIPAVSLARDPSGNGAGAAVGTMHRMKGLEFRCLAVVGAGSSQLPAPRSVTPEEEDPGAHVRDLLRERSLLFVACTRAREQLSVSWHQEPSPFLEPLVNPA
ncbi:UvrD-helicase domain-containing protein [Nocardiopsis dassonvillei]|uniref:DNA 3'-5' helicase n=1 Tax=Nocardiopsis dassonvillei (strain ATCC 23218 / DSM 43111 / CIP 107115 / JCM 7437 / KCTC 9190 / NBRC 14626 / NCTC 10488 / NRRL B-5397 / IMRU 509) TaxID=446468 RepID=D7AYY4_NOCDD|nr:UvrD-helicase domain-containing protein [Nocardiopsis dassonvillei]ADH68146.1 UvrD/REP helicase [Nocardiopsis dassonvillei subsp. dassonvillei DSM 43111]NKY77208.1 AAA family ATPase [Nocardiopsis dassonvillei]VEI88649.1 Putative ATP-dependent DNA helicase yjcD [Nocardiopsis dassonvillei]